MSSSHRFASCTAAATAAALLLSLSWGGWEALTSGAGRTGILAVFADLPQAVATYFPVAVLAGGIGRGSAPSAHLRGLQRLWTAGAVSVLALVLAGFLVPWSTGLLAGLLDRAPAASESMTMPEWAVEYRRLRAAESAGEGVLPWMIGVAGVHLAFPATAALLAFVNTLLGDCIGRCARTLPSRVQAMHFWAAGLAVIVGVGVAAAFATTASVRHGVHPGAVVLLPPAPPALLLVGMSWAALVGRSVPTPTLAGGAT